MTAGSGPGTLAAQAAPPGTAGGNGTALTTGGAGGTGSAIARRLRADGFRVVITDVDRAAGERVRHDLQVEFIRCDCASEPDMRHAVRLSGPVQVLNDSAVIEPMPVPDRPLPLLSVPFPLEVLQVRTLPVLVSFSVVVPALAVMAPPGLTVQVAATPVLLAANAELADRASIPASAALMTRTLPARLRIVIRVSPLPDQRA